MQRIDIGIDAGGTKTRLEARFSDGAPIHLERKGSNPRVVGVDGTIEILGAMISDACGSKIAGADVCLCAGIAGASTSDVQRAIASGISPSFDAGASARIEITDDATTSFEAAFAGKPGTLLLLGTGSNIICKTFDEEWIHSGGWGFLIGDEGSGYAIGKLGLRAVARAIDRNLKTRLATRATADFGLHTRDHFLSSIYGGPLHIADFARVVLEEAACGDIEARLLVSEAVGALVDDLASSVEAYADRLPRTIRVVGGLSRSTVYMDELRTAVFIRLGEAWEIEPSARTPLEGALWIASNLNDR